MNVALEAAALRRLSASGSEVLGAHLDTNCSTAWTEKIGLDRRLSNILTPIE
jgi:hypothetical protein